MSKAHRGTGLYEMPLKGRGTCPVCKREGIKAIYEIIAEAREAGYERVAVVTHGVFIRSLLAGIFGKNFAIKALLAKGMENGSITELQYLPDRDLFTLERLNDYAHLEDEPELLRRTWK